MSDAERMRRLEDQLRRRRGDLVSLPARLVVPRICEFDLDSGYLNKPWLYPNQGFVLKLITIDLDGLTDYDRAFIATCTAGFRVQEGSDGIARYAGSAGMPPDILERAARLRDEDRKWFRDVIMVLGRRGGKGHLGGSLGAFLIWNLLALEDPHAVLGLDATKRFVIPVFAAQHEQARTNQWRDLTQTIIHAPCFQPFIADPRANSLLLFTPAQLRNGRCPDPDDALIEIVARVDTLPEVALAALPSDAFVGKVASANLLTADVSFHGLSVGELLIPDPKRDAVRKAPE